MQHSPNSNGRPNFTDQSANDTSQNISVASTDSSLSIHSHDGKAYSKYVPMSSTDSSQNASFSPNSGDTRPKKKNSSRRAIKTYRGIESRGYNSNVYTGKLNTHRSLNSVNQRTESTSHGSHKEKERVAVHDGDIAYNDPRNAFEGINTSKAEWTKILSTSRSEDPDRDGTESHFKALNECAACGQGNVRLKLLPCLHSFCTECLEKQIEQATSFSWMKCPLCNRRTEINHKGVDGFEDNIYFEFSDFSISENDRCQICSEAVPRCRCSVCDQNFCNDCVKEHLANQKETSHYIVNVAAEMVGKTSLETVCKEHNPFTLSLYCVNCTEPVCGRCAIGKHNNHVVEDAQVAANDMRNDLKGIVTAGIAARLTKDIADHMHTARKERTKLEADIDQAVSVVQLHVRGLKEELDEFEKDMIQKIKRKESTLLTTLNKKARDSEVKLRSTHLSLETMRRIIDRARDIEMIEKFPELKSLALDLRKSVKPPPTQCVRMGYTPMIQSLKSSVGRIHIEAFLQRPLELVEICSFQLFKHISSIFPIDGSHAWIGFRKYAQLCSKDGSYGTRLDFGEPVMSIDGNSAGTVLVACKSCMKVISSRLSPKFLFQLPHEPSDIKFDETDNIIICFKDARRVSMYTQKGKHLKELDLRHLGFRLGTRINDPWKISISDSGDIYITDYTSESISVFDKEGEIKTAFSTNVFRHSGIAFTKGLLLISDYKRDCVQVYSEDGQYLQTCRITGINAPCSISADGTGDIWVGSWGGMVKVFTQR